MQPERYYQIKAGFTGFRQQRSGCVYYYRRITNTVEGSVRLYRISRCCEILYFIRSAAYCQTCEQNSRALHAQTMLSGLALCSLMKKIPTHLLILYGLTEPSAVLVILR